LTRHPGSSHHGLRLLALGAVALGLLLLAAAAFVLSYPGVHAVALATGVSPRLARIYPLILDAMVVVAGAAVLSLRGAGLPSRWYAWLSLLVMLAADAGADTLHAVGARLPLKQSAAAAAIIPWALLLIGFSLLLTMLRHARVRARREPGEPPEAAAPEAGPAPETDVARKTSPLPRAELGPGAGAQGQAVTQPEPQYGYRTEAEFKAEEETRPSDDGEPEDDSAFETDNAFETEGNDGPEDETEPDDDLAAENDIEDNGENGAPSGAEPETLERESEPGLEGAGFERVRSTPLPPGE
jgi:hypothetical protein